MGESGTITLHDRTSLHMDGVSEVLSLDSDFVSVMTTLGKVEIEGDGLRVLDLSSESGKLSLVGRIDGIYYTDKPGAKRGWKALRAK